MSNTLLESLWARVTANIGDRIDQINGLLTQALTANTESIAARDGAVTAEDNAATSASNASTSESNAAVSESNAAASESAAELAKNDAAQSKADAALSASAADGDAGAAAASASSAAQSESSAATHAQSALGYAGQAEDARDESRLARDEAVQAAENAQQGAPSGGWKKAELSQPVQDSLSRADTALQSIPVATASAPGSIRLSGDLGGTSQAPTVPGLADKADSVHKHTTADITDSTDWINHSSHPNKVVRTREDGFVHGDPPTEDRHVATKGYVDARPALFSGSGAPPSSISGAVVGDWWLDTSTMELHKITGV